MAFDPVHQSQLYIWRAARLLRDRSHDRTRLDRLDAEGRERFFDGALPQLASLEARMEAHAASTLESRRVLDYGCGVGRMALPLAERCEHVYGLDVSPAVLREADRNAQRLNLTNVEWMDAARLAELSGCYDMVVSFFVFQHIPSRKGERIFAELLDGLRPGGVGAIQLTLRSGLRRLDRSYLYMLTNSYSLNRLGRLLAAGGVSEWHAKMHQPSTSANGVRPSHDDVTILFRKD
jgi:2-polyprenyl-3-methyl-5-hydroxy-6-metoxy-1,4-benzoquinol methylase